MPLNAAPHVSDAEQATRASSSSARDLQVFAGVSVASVPISN
ncbi:hypothetical protein BZL30_9430 [Mycobacterium kansasii]|uniref:Uncharacterized protein n=1 Tax=Mycobacterium kansasii TaxID=1768 RepID=A0A1V3WA56_MYCKA|nr:hypothetical protein BZL30_9430 [Mycobacterium kansasii]